MTSQYASSPIVGRVFSWLFFACAATAVGVALWLGLRYTWLFEIFAEWQIRHFGWYLPGITVALLFLIMMVPVVITGGIWRGLRKRRNTFAITRSPVQIAGGFHVALKCIAGGLAIAAVVPLIMALALPSGGEPRRDLSLSVIDWRTANGPVRLSGGAVDSRVAIHHQFYLIGRRDTPYSMLVDRRNATGSMFVEMAVSSKGQYILPSRDGILVRNALPGTIEVLFDGHGVRVARPHYVLFRSVESYRLPYYMTAAELAGFAIVAALIAAVQGKRLRSLGEAPKPPVVAAAS